MVTIFSPIEFKQNLCPKNMENKKILCTLCGKEIKEDEGDLCETCFNVLKQKYPEKKKFEWRKKWLKKFFKKDQKTEE